MTVVAETVLVVDDNPLNLELVTDVLSAAGFSVRQARSGEETVLLARSEQPRLILLDIGLPGMDGYQTLAALRADAQTRGIVIIALTAFAMSGDEGRARAAGFDGYISKPIQTRTLAESVTRLIQEKGRRHDG